MLKKNSLAKAATLVQIWTKWVSCNPENVHDIKQIKSCGNDAFQNLKIGKVELKEGHLKCMCKKNLK